MGPIAEGAGAHAADDGETGLPACTESTIEATAASGYAPVGFVTA